MSNPLLASSRHLTSNKTSFARLVKEIPYHTNLENEEWTYLISRTTNNHLTIAHKFNAGDLRTRKKQSSKIIYRLPNMATVTVIPNSEQHLLGMATERRYILPCRSIEDYSIRINTTSSNNILKWKKQIIPRVTNVIFKLEYQVL